KDFRPIRHPGRPGCAQRHPAHHFDTARYDDVLLAGHHRLHGEVHGLLAGTARPVDRGTRDALGPAGGQHRVTTDIARLIPDLRHASPYHVVDNFGVDTGALYEFVED